jgi:hypothetical protein
MFEVLYPTMLLSSRACSLYPDMIFCSQVWYFYPCVTFCTHVWHFVARYDIFLLPSFWFTVHIISGYEPDRYGLNSFPLFEFRHLYICRRFQIFKAITKQRKWSHENSSVDVWKFPKELWGFEPAILFSWGKLMTTLPRLQGAKVWSGGHFLGTASRLTSTSTYVPTNIHAIVCTYMMMTWCNEFLRWSCRTPNLNFRAWHRNPRSYARRSMFEKGRFFSADRHPILCSEYVDVL